MNDFYSALFYLGCLMIMVSAPLRLWKSGLRRRAADLEAKYTELFEGTPVAFHEVDLEGFVRRVNSAECDLLGFGRDEIVGKPYWDFLAAGKLEDARLHWRGKVNGNRPLLSYDAQYRRKDGSPLLIEIHESLMKSKAGQVLGMRSTLIDITHRRLMTEALQKSAAHTRSILVTALDGVITFRPDGAVETANQAAERMFGYSEKEMLGKPASQFFGGDMVHSGTSPSEMTVLRRGGERLPAEVSVSGFDAGGVIYRTAIFRDITERKRTHDKLERTALELRKRNGELDQALREARAATEMKARFLANMSHEIRTPMNGVVGMTELLLATEMTMEQREYATFVGQSADRLLHVLNDILDFSKIEAGKLELESIPFDLAREVEEAVSMFSLRAFEKNLELACLVRPGTPKFLRGDPGRLRQILSNLVSNAVKFTDKGEITVIAELQEQREGKALIRVAVRDTGIGIPPGAQARLFQSFEQGDASTTRKYGGTGLGLAISRQLTRLLGGDIYLSSEAGKGSMFWFTAELEMQSSELIAPDDAAQRFAGMRVLVVDDNETNRALLREILNSWGCRPDDVSSGTEALQAMRAAFRENDPYQLALLDFQMPEIDGFTTCENIRADSRFDGTVLFCLTSGLHPGDVARAKTLGFAGTLYKPIRQSYLFNALFEVLRQRTDPSRELKRITPLEAKPFGQLQRWEGIKVLVAEDNEINQKIAARYLEKSGVEVRCASNGRKALEALNEESFNLVLMDIQMPEMDGLDATVAIRSNPRLAQIPVVAMTANAMTGDRERCMEAGMDDYLSKPVQLIELNRVLERWLGRSSRADVEPVVLAGL